jgi:hypothetical protein
MKISQPNTLIEKQVDIRCLQIRISMAGQISIALIIGHNEDDVGFLDAGSWILDAGY